MPTQKFFWKDRDTAALDLLQLVYHAPQFISQHALGLLSAIRSDVITADLKALALDTQRPYWDRVYALRALGEVRDGVYFPELRTIVDGALLQRKHIIDQHGSDPEGLAHLCFPEDQMWSVFAFVEQHPTNEDWLLSAIDEADPRVRYTVLIEQLPRQMPHSLSDRLIDRLLSLVETYPELLTLSAANRLYAHYEQNPQVQILLQAHLGTIASKAAAAKPSERSSFDLQSSIPWQWPELRAEIFRLRPDFEEKYARDQARLNRIRDNALERRIENPAYQETIFWQELVRLYEQAQTDSNAIWQLYHKAYDRHLTIPQRAAAAHFLGKFHDQSGVTHKLRFLASYAQDNDWDDGAPVCFEASRALFETGSPEAWEALIEAYLSATDNLFMTALKRWISRLTDVLSGVDESFEETDYGVRWQWQNALARESAG